MLKQWAKKLKRDIPALFLALRHPGTPAAAKILAAITVCYALSPLDLIPDFIPVLGYLDDLLILPVLAALTIRLIPREVLAECREKGEDLWKNGKPKRWYYAIPIVILWIVLLVLILRRIFPGG